ncbi:uncharacterized protein LOC133897290 [Phragmites australis]|uniref:uncharacterized protein LOC133897290 n=1 Tax=Phragmites australis TaxID=29695 RepID=UPI002D770F16|nr:uncharacterized protein LOC133897290 [Phragmites australis]
MASLAILLLMARFSGSIAISSNYYISRSAEQQVIATVAPAVIPDADGQSAQPFLTSPSGSYAAYLGRAVDSSGGLGGDTCYVQIQRAGGGGGGNSVWESDCTPVGGADTCDLAFSPVGLELFAGGHSLWDTGVDADPGLLSLDDGGDMKIVSREGVTVWTASGEPWTGQQCGAPLPVSSAPSMDALPPPLTANTKLVTPPAATLAGTGSTDFSFGDQPAPPPFDMLPDLPAQPPVDTAPEQPLAPPPVDASPDLSLAPPPAHMFPDLPDQPLAPPPTEMSPDQQLFSSPPPAPAVFGPQTPMPPFGMAPLAAPATGASGETSHGIEFPGTAAPPGEPGSPGGVPISASSPVGLPHQHGPPHHDLPFGASPPLPDALAPAGHGAGAGLPFGQGQQQRGQGVFGQQQQLLNGAGQRLEDSSGGWSRSERGRVAVCVALAALMALGFGF